MTSNMLGEERLSREPDPCFPIARQLGLSSLVNFHTWTMVLLISYYAYHNLTFNFICEALNPLTLTIIILKFHILGYYPCISFKHYSIDRPFILLLHFLFPLFHILTSILRCQCSGSCRWCCI